ncbi:MAG: hypothetical protein HYS22_03280 [Deltaproteobacteria bacterium]|nr:hypothetical protein [Deltaproteobacteria bacterium]
MAPPGFYNLPVYPPIAPWATYSGALTSLAGYSRLGFSKDPAHTLVDFAEHPIDYLNSSPLPGPHEIGWEEFQRNGYDPPLVRDFYLKSAECESALAGKISLNPEKALACQNYHPLNSSGVRAVAVPTLRVAAAGIGAVSLFTQWRKIPGEAGEQKLPLQPTLYWTVYYTGAYAAARAVSDMAGAARLRYGDEATWNMSRWNPADINFTVQEAEWALRPWNAWSTHVALDWAARINVWMFNKAGEAAATAPAYPVETWISQRMAALSPGVQKTVKAGAILGGAYVVYKGGEAASHLARGEYETTAEMREQAALTVLGAGTAGLGVRQFLQSKTVFPIHRIVLELRTMATTHPARFAEIAGIANEPAAITAFANNPAKMAELARRPAALTNTLLYLDNGEAALVRASRNGERFVGASRLVLWGLGALVVYEGFEAAERLISSDSFREAKNGDWITDTALCTAGVFTGVTLAANVTRAPFFNRWPGLRDNVFVATTIGGERAVAATMTTSLLLAAPQRSGYMLGYLWWRGLGNGIVNTLFRGLQGYNDLDVLIAEFGRSFVTPLPGTIYDGYYRSTTGRAPSTFQSLVWSNVAYQIITAVNQTRQTGSMNYASLSRRWASATPEEKEGLATAIQDTDEGVRVSLLQRTRDRFSETLSRLEKSAARFHTLCHDNRCQLGVNRIYDQTLSLQKELETGLPDPQAAGDVVRRAVTQTGKALWFWGQHPTLDRIEAEIGRLEEQLGDRRQSEERDKETLLKGMREEIRWVSRTRNDFFDAIRERDNVATNERNYYVRGLERYLKKR